MLPFQAELYRAIFPHHITQSRTVLISRADDIRPYSSNRANGFLQRGHGRFFRITALCRGLRKICRSKAWGSVNEGAHFVCVTEFTGSHNAAPADFSAVRSLHERHGDGFYLHGIIIHFARQAVVEIVVPYLAGAVDDFSESAAYLVKFRGELELRLHIEKLGFGALYRIAHALAGYPLVFRDLGERQVVVVVIAQKVALFFSQHIAVKVKQNSYFQILCHFIFSPFSS